MKSFRQVWLLLLALLFLITACKPEEPNPSLKLEGTTWTRFEGDQPGGLNYQVMEFKKNGIGRTDYRIDKVTLNVPIVEFTYKYDSRSVWVTVDKGKSDKYVQEGRFVGENIVFGNYMYYREK